jgi:hypothetical protein
LVADPFSIDQHFIQHPSELFENSLDDLVVDIDNELILEGIKLLWLIFHAEMTFWSSPPPMRWPGDSPYL